MTGSGHVRQWQLLGLPSTMRSLGAMKGWESGASRAVTVAVPRIPEPTTGQSNMVSRPELALISVRLTMTVRMVVLPYPVADRAQDQRERAAITADISAARRSRGSESASVR